MILPPAELLARLSTTLRKEIGPAIDSEYPRTQAFMAAVVAEKLARQVAVGPAHERADAADRAQLFTDLDALLPAGGTPSSVRAIVDEGVAGGGTAVVCRLIEALYANEHALGRPSFDAALGRVRATLRAGIDRQMEYAGVTDAPTMEDRIRDYLAKQLPASELRLVGIEQIAVGWSHETWLFDAHWHDGTAEQTQGFCLRRDPGNALLRELSDLAVQFRVLQCLEPTAVPTPKPYWYEDDPAILGAPFLVMEKVPGTCPNPWGRDGRRFYEEAAGRGVLPASFTDALAALHTLDWEAAGLSFLGVPAAGTGFALGEIEKWRTLIEQTEPEPEPILTDLVCWLEANAPETERLALVHGAYRTGNVLVEDDRVSAILDWELQVIGDPMYDVAYVLSDLNREGTALLSNLVARDDFYRWYEAATGIEIDEEVCRYYQLLYAMRSVAFWMSASDLYSSGRSGDLRLARTQWSTPVVLERAARDLGY